MVLTGVAVDSDIEPGDGDPVGARFRGGKRRPVREVFNQPRQPQPLVKPRSPAALVEGQVGFLRAFVPADSDVVPKVFGVFGPNDRLASSP